MASKRIAKSVGRELPMESPSKAGPHNAALGDTQYSHGFGLVRRTCIRGCLTAYGIPPVRNGAPILCAFIRPQMTGAVGGCAAGIA